MERSYSFKENAICRRCLGEGIIVTPGYDHGHGHKANEVVELCDLCLGARVVVIEKNINVTITPKSKAPYGNK